MVKHRPLLSFWVIRPCSLASDCKPIVELITGDIVPAYNEKKRAGGTLPTTINYTGQRLDGSGLVYMNARYYDPLVGMFISPDTIVPDAGVLIDYNRYAYARGNSLKYNDPSGHCIFGIDTAICIAIAIGAFAGGTAAAVSNTGVQVAQNWDSTRELSENFTDFNKTETAIAFGYGAVGGGLAPVTGGASALIINGGLGAAQEVTTDMVIEGKTFTEALDAETAIAGGFGVVGGMVQNSIPTKLSYSLSEGHEFGLLTGKEAVAWGGTQYAKNNATALFGDQLQQAVNPRIVTGALVGNLPAPVKETGQCSWSCPIQTVQKWWNGSD